MITKEMTMYFCEHCNKMYRRPKWCEKHEAKCFKSPANDRPCFNCKHLSEDEFESCTHYHYDGTEYTAHRRVLHCDKNRVCVYPPQISEPYELLDVDNIAMPLTCNELVEK